ncbi:hypothetical protein [Serratia liquefaciens]|uniref:hypothetical protein n=1 Tax=Serratia liquefaciens TaxID=614 RepID=UPI00101ED29A|nr:hypothetical protein [Serratia liquefaciens]
MHTKVTQGAQHYIDGWQKLLENKHASLDWHPNPQAVIYRGKDSIHTENYGTLFNDATAAYALALRWKISGDDAYARKAINLQTQQRYCVTRTSGIRNIFMIFKPLC